MPVSKIKNLIILILGVCVLALLLQVLPVRAEQARSEQDLYIRLEELFASYDIDLNGQDLPSSVRLYALELSGYEAGSVRAAQTLLGEDARAEASATRLSTQYTAARGTCTTSLDGSIHAELTGTEKLFEQNRAADLLEEMGFDVHSLTATELGTLQARQALLGVPVFSDGIRLTYAGGMLREVSGVFFIGAEQLTRISEEACISCADALMAFLSNRDALGWVGSTVLSVEQGYKYTESAATALRLTPVWRIETDTGSFEVNGLSGEIAPLAAVGTMEKALPEA